MDTFSRIYELQQKLAEQCPSAGSQVLEPDDQEARVTSYVMLLRLSDGPRINHTGMYRHTLRKVDGAWKFAHRRMDQDR